MIIHKPGHTSRLDGSAKSAETTGGYPVALSRLPVCWRTPDGKRVWAPLVEMYSCNDAIVVHAELPGLGQEDISLKLLGNDLIIQGERKANTVSRTKNYMNCEISYGNFFRAVSLPVQIKKSGIKASYTNGILEVELPIEDRKSMDQVKIKVRSPKASLPV